MGKKRSDAKVCARTVVGAGGRIGVRAFWGRGERGSHGCAARDFWWGRAGVKWRMDVGVLSELDA